MLRYTNSVPQPSGGLNTSRPGDPLNRKGAREQEFQEATHHRGKRELAVHSSSLARCNGSKLISQLQHSFLLALNRAASEPLQRCVE
jgi:hypothetical protein